MAASLLPNGKQQFIDINGNPLVGGTVGMYRVGTLIPKDTWENSSQTVLNTNPIILDQRGQALIYGHGVYRQILKDKDNNLIWDQPTAEPGYASNAVFAVENLAALMDLGPDAAQYESVYLEGYNYPGDGGGGELFITTNPSVPANNVTVYALGGGVYAERCIQTPVNLRWCGITSDGREILETTITGNSLTGPSGSFSLTDVGKAVACFGAGAGTNSLFTTVSIFVSDTQVLLTDAASTDQTSVPTQIGTQSRLVLQAAIYACVDIGYKCFRLDGNYMITDGDSSGIPTDPTSFLYLFGTDTTFDFTGCTLFGCALIGDIRDTSLYPEGVKIIGGTSRPLGDMANSAAASVGFNGVAIAIGYNCIISNWDIYARWGSRGISIQTGPFWGSDSKNTRIHNLNASVRIFGDQDRPPNTGVDISWENNATPANADNLINNVVISAEVYNAATAFAVVCETGSYYAHNISANIIGDNIVPFDTIGYCCIISKLKNSQVSASISGMSSRGYFISECDATNKISVSGAQSTGTTGDIFCFLNETINNDNNCIVDICGFGDWDFGLLIGSNGTSLAFDLGGMGVGITNAGGFSVAILKAIMRGITTPLASGVAAYPYQWASNLMLVDNSGNVTNAGTGVTPSLNGGTPVTVNNAFIGPKDIVDFSIKTLGGTQGSSPRVAASSIVSGTSFNVVADSGDTSVYNYIIQKNG